MVTACTALRGGRGRSSRVGLGLRWALAEDPSGRRFERKAALPEVKCARPRCAPRSLRRRRWLKPRPSDWQSSQPTVGVSETRRTFAAARPRFRSRATAPTCSRVPAVGVRKSARPRGVKGEAKGSSRSRANWRAPGFGQHAVSTRLEEFGQPNGLLHSLDVHASGKAPAPAVHQRCAHADPAVALELGSQTGVVEGSFSNSPTARTDGCYSTPAAVEQGIGLLENPLEGISRRRGDARD